MKQKILCVLFLFLQFTYAQTPGMDVLEKERQIKNTLNSQPEIARVYINELLNYKARLNDTVYASAYLYYGYYYNLKNNVDSSLYCYSKASALIDEFKDAKLYGRLLRNKAVAYKKKSNHTEALRLLSIAEAKYKSANDLTGIAVVYGEMASNYNMLSKSDEAIEFLLKAIAILEKTKDKFNIVTVKMTLANTYLNAGNLVFAADLYKETLKELKEQKLDKTYAIGLINYSDCLIKLNRLNEAQNALDTSLPILKKFEDDELITFIYAKMGNIKMEENDFSKAEAFYKKALEKAIKIKSSKTIAIATDYIGALNQERKFDSSLKIIDNVEKIKLLKKTNLEEKLDFERKKEATYDSIKNKDQALIAEKTILKIEDTLRKSSNDSITSKLQRQYQNKYQAKKAESLESRNAKLTAMLHKRKMIKLIPVFCIGFLFIITFIVFIIKCRNNSQKLEQAKSNKDLLLKEYENTKTLNILNKENLEHKKQELVSGMISLATLEGNINKLVAQCSENPSQMCINEIKNQLQSLTSENDYWKLFRKRFNEAYSGFQSNLEKQFPELTKNDLFFCALLKLNLPYKDMAMLMQVSPESIVKKKYRIKKKMNLDTEQELENILLNTLL